MEEELLSTFLQETGGQGDYLEGIPSNQIQPKRLKAIYDRVTAEGTFLVTSHYATLANAVAGEPTPSPDVINDAVRIIHKGLSMLKKEMGIYGEDVAKFSPQDLIRLRRALAVMVFLAHRALSGMEAKSVQYVLGSGSGNNKTKGHNVSARDAAFGGNEDASGINWRNLRSMIIEDLLAILQLPVEKIWNDTGYGYSVPRLLIRTMCSNFNEACLAKENLRAGDEAYKIFGIIAKRFNKPADVYQRLFPLIKYGEDVAKLVSRSVEVMNNEFHLEDAVLQAFQTVMNTVETEVGQSDKNSALAEKGAAQLVGDLCEMTPAAAIVKGGFYLVQLLKVDSVPIRSACVQGSCHLLRWLKTNDGEEGANGKLGTLILDGILINHCRDANSLIRAKCIQILAKLIDEHLLEPMEVAACMTAAIDRINDSTVLPRKYSLLMINHILAKYPGICSATINFKEEVDIHRKRLLELMAKTSFRKSYFIYAIIREFTEQVRVQEIPLPEAYDDDIEQGMSKVRLLIAKLIREDKYWDACTVMYHTFQRYGSESGIRDAGKSAAIPSMYIQYFKTIATNLGDSADSSESQLSMLNDSFDLSKNMSSHESELLENEEVTAERKILQFSQGCLKMKQQLSQLVEKLILLLQIGQPSDQMEVVNTIGQLVRCGYPVNEKFTGPVIQAIAGLAEESAGNLIPAFWSIFIGDIGIGNVQMIRNIFKILDSVDGATRDLLKPMIGEMYTSGSLSKPAVVILWDAFNRTFDTWSARDAKNAIFVIGAVGRCDKFVITANFAFLMKTGLGDEALNDMELVRCTLEAILFSLKATKKGESDVKTTHRLIRNHALFNRLIDILAYGLTKKGSWETHQYFPRVAELAVQIIYRLSWDHIPFTNRLLSIIPPIVFGNRNENQDISESEIRDSEEIFIRYMAIMTALLGTHINYCETVVIPEIKRRKVTNTMGALVNIMEKSGINTTGVSSVSTSMRNSFATSTSSSVGNRGAKKGRGRKAKANSSTAASCISANGASSTLSEMEAIIGNTGFDAELDIVKTYVEKLLDQGTFQQLRRLTLYFCQKITTIHHRKLKLAVVIAVAKLMLVSAESVGKLIEPFINLWNIVDDDSVKVEILKQLTVLSVRFPNQVERCNVIIKSGLMSNNTQIKTACLDFMGYLSLGDMVKIRDSIAEVALCLTSEKLVIRELARDFFDVCAEKDNVISNAVPEVISQLSNREGLSQQDFQGIMKFLLVRVKKEKQVVGLVETLVNRFKGPTRQGRLWEDNAHCLSQLPHGEKTFKIIRDNFQLYSDKLENEAVFRSFLLITETLRRVIQKPDIKAKIDDYEKDLEEFREKCMEKSRIEKVKSRQTKRQRIQGGDDSSLMEDGGDNNAHSKTTSAKDNPVLDPVTTSTSDNASSPKKNTESTSESDSDIEMRTKLAKDNPVTTSTIDNASSLKKTPESSFENGSDIEMRTESDEHDDE